MENVRLNSHYLKWESTITHPAIVCMVLFILSIGLHHSALSAGWRFDDGAHLEFAMTYSPWQYFFVPEITRLQSGANLTPWNALFYDINLSLFGFNPLGFYFHQLVIIWLTSVATYFLLKLWLNAYWAMFGAMLFLISAPTVHIANQIMTGHYSTGLLFTVIALYAYARAVRENRQSLALAGALFYLFAVACKEVYVPLIAVLPFLPVGTMKKRLRYAIPTLFVVMGYLVWRMQVLGRLFGGYNLGGSYNLNQIIETFMNIPLLLFGDHIAMNILCIAIMLLVLYALYYKRISFTLLMVGAGVMVFPLIPLISYPGITSPDRYLFVIGWGSSVLIACTLALPIMQHKKYITIAIAFLMIVMHFLHASNEQTAVTNSALVTEKSYAFMLNSNAKQVYIAPDFNYYFGAVLPSAIMAQKMLNPLSPERARVIPDIEQLSQIDLALLSTWRYDNQCECVKDVTTSVPTLIADYKSKLVQKALSVQLSLGGLKAEWNLGPYYDGEYAIMINNQGFLNLPRKGVHSYPSNTLKGYILYKSPEGWITKSESFHLDELTQSTWSWSRPL